MVIEHGERAHRARTQGPTLARRSARCLSAVLAVAVVMLAGCTSVGSTSNSAGKAAKSSASAPSGFAGQTLTLQSSDPVSLNPALVGLDTVAITFNTFDYDPLIYQTSTGSFVPDLATKWGYVAGSSDKVFQLTIRSGVTFSDGTELTAQAVANSLAYFKKAQGVNAALLASLKSIAVTAPLTLTLNFSASTPDLPLILSQGWNVGAIIGPKGLADPASLATQSDGTGPYTISPTGIIANSQYTFEANPHYWNPSAVHYHQIVVKVIDDPSATLAAIESGQIDAALGNVAPGIGVAAKSAGFTVLPAPFSIASLILADRGGTTSPLGKLEVREAINYALDRPALANVISGAYGKPTDQLSLPGAPGYSAVLGNYYSYDVTKAKSLLADAGYPNGFTLSVLETTQLDPNSTIAQGIASELASIGIKVKLTVAPTFVQYVPDAFSRKYPAMVLPVEFDGGGFYYAMSSALGTFFNPFNSTDPELTSLLSQAAASTGSAEQEAVFEKLNQRLIQLAWFAPVSPLNNVFIISPKLGGVGTPSLTSSGLLDPVGPAPDLSWYPKA
jgi:peptide/nickel transport system substrate-binding protein